MQELRSKLSGVDGLCALALVYTALGLTVLEYVFYPPLIEGRLQGAAAGTRLAPSLEAGVIWSVGTAVVFLVVPLLLVLFVHKARPSSIGYSLEGFRRHVWVYLGFFLFPMLPVVLFAASRDDFHTAYPFVREATRDWNRFLIWELAYLTQFFALESFFRGYLLFTLERKIGWLAIFVMTVPYCMIHYHKPPLEAFAAIVAGIALGALALRNRSFYGGVLLHVLVAATMELIAAHRAGLF